MKVPANSVMNAPRMYKPTAALRVCVFLVCAGVVATAVHSRQLRMETLQERLADADAVFIGRVVGIENRDPFDDVASFARVEILKDLAGPLREGDVVSLVCRGPIEELDPASCIKGESYIVLAKKGYVSLELVDDSLRMIEAGRDLYYSVVNGAYGACLIETSQLETSLGRDPETLSGSELVRAVLEISGSDCRELLD